MNLERVSDDVGIGVERVSDDDEIGVGMRNVDASLETSAGSLCLCGCGWWMHSCLS
jgi:hypothetical protein